MTENVRELFMANLSLIEQAIRFVCLKNHVDAEEREDFASHVMLKLIENDHAVIRKFAGRSSLATFIISVTQRLLLDDRIHAWGKWHPSTEAQRCGNAAVLLERLLHRDGHTFEEAARRVLTEHPQLSRSALETLAAQLPRRTGRRRAVDLTEATEVAVTAGNIAEEAALETEQRTISNHVSQLMRAAIDVLPEEDRAIFQLRFECDMNMAQIARSLHVPEKQVQRRFRKRLRALRTELEHHGVSGAEVLAIIGENGSIFEFPLSATESRPSTSNEAVTDAEELTR